MENLLDKEYLHNGTDIIYKELWNKIYMNPENSNYAKPVGGFWTVEYNETFSEWIDFLYDRKRSMYYDAVNKKNLILKLKDKSKILTIKDKNDYKNLLNSGLIMKLDTPIKQANIFGYDIIEEIPDYYKIEELYDALYVTPYGDTSLNTFAVNTMLILNPDAIDYFKRIEFLYTTEDDICSMEVKTIGKKEKIKQITDNYYKLFNLIENEFINKIKSSKDLNTIRNILIKEFNSNDKIDLLIRNGIEKTIIIRSIIHNIETKHKDEIKRLIKK